MEFREFIEKEKYQFTDLEVANMYFAHPHKTIKEIIDTTGFTKRELYDVVHRHGQPNRLGINHHNVISLADQGMEVNQIAQATHYSVQNVKRILEKQK